MQTIQTTARRARTRYYRRGTVEAIAGIVFAWASPSDNPALVAMSIDPKFALRPRRDVNANVKERSVARRAPLQMSVGLEERKRLRTVAPANTPLRRTLMWVKTLPPDIQPVALVRRFARIANLLAATWGDPKSFDTYMESLLTDGRGNRRGFPAAVHAEFVALQRYRDTLMDDASAWDTQGKRG